MVDSDTLMRYIRVFSELSNQIRYASQKRVLVEIALIKLCRPAMETNLDSVLDRIRILEDKMESGVPVQASASSGKEALPQKQEEAEVKEPIKPPVAAPEDLQYIKQNWKSLIRETSGLFYQMLQNSVPKYNGDTGEPKLYVEFQSYLAQACIDNPENAVTLSNIIQKKLGKSIELELIIKRDNKEARTGLAEISVDDILKDKIHMDVVIEDDF